jgi:hypothetical protein
MEEKVAMVAVAKPAPMCDVEYLLDPQTVSRPIVYRYRSGVLISAVHSALDRMVGQQGRYFLPADPFEFHEALSGTTLFDESIQFCYWPRRKTRAVAKQGWEIVRALADDDSRPGILFAHIEDSIFKQPNWSRVGRRSLILDEAVASPEAVGRIVDYLFTVTDLPSCPIDRSRVIRHFQIVLEQEGREGFDQFAHRFDVAMLLHCDADTGKFAPPPPQVADSLDRSYIMGPLRRLVEGQREEAIDDLVVNLGVRLRIRGEKAVRILSSLCELTTILLDHKGAGTERGGVSKGGEGTRFDTEVVLWSAVLLVWGHRMLIAQSRVNEKLVPMADASLTLLAQMVRDFYTRATTGCQSNPIFDLWPEIQIVLRDYSESRALIPRPRARDQTIAALAARLAAGRSNSLRPGWIAELDQLMSIAVDKRNERDEIAP